MSARMRLTNILGKAGPRDGKLKPNLQQAAQKKRWDIVRGDKVEVIGSHPEKGKQGVVLQVLRKLDRIIVEGVNLGPKHIKGNSDRGLPGRMIQTERAVHYSKVNLVDPVTSKPTRIMKKILEDGSKVRVSVKSGAIIPRPDILTFRKRPVSAIVTESDTLDDDVWQVTYQPPTLVNPPTL
jgi:large subunit ribosomal protein L24